MLARRWMVILALLAAGAWGVLVRDLTGVLIGLLALVYYELLLQTRLLEVLLRRLPSASEIPQGEEASVSSEEPEPPAPEEVTPRGPGYQLTEPEYVIPPPQEEAEAPEPR